MQRTRNNQTEKVSEVENKEIIPKTIEKEKEAIDIIAETEKEEGAVRSTKTIEPMQLKWRKLGGGSLRIGSRLIKPNETFLAHVKEIPMAFKDSIECLESIEAQAENIKLNREVVAPKKPIYTLELHEETEDGDSWDVVNMATGKPINETPLDIDAAQTLIAALEAD